VLVGVAVFAFLMIAQPLPRAVGEPLAWGTHSATVLVASAAMLRRARLVQGRLRHARVLVGCAMLVGATGGALAVLSALVPGPSAMPSVVDVVHLSFVPLAALALLRYPVTEDKAGSAARSLLDGAVASMALWFVAYALLLGPAQVTDGLSLPVMLTTLAYPAGDLFVLGLLVSVLPRVSLRARRELVVTGTGLALFAAADVAFTVQTTSGAFRADSWVAVLYECGLLLMAAGALAPEASSAAISRWGRVLATLPQLPVLAAVAVAAALAATGGNVSGMQLMVGVALVVVLFLRQLVSSRDRDVLTDRLQARDELFRSLVTGASDLITLHDAEGRVTWASPAAERVLGVGEEDLLGRSLGDLVEPNDRLRLREAFTAAVLQPSSQVDITLRVRSGSGEWRWMQVLLDNQLDHPSVRGVVSNSRDVHERHVLERQLAHAAFHDALTGLGNLARARALLQAVYDSPAEATVLLVDLDGFKAVNDTFGHAYGDALLCKVAERLTGCLRAGDEASRLGGDEFVLVLRGLQDAGPTSSRVLAALREPVEVAGTTLSIRASLGVALTVDAATPDELLRNADLAMYASKAAGRDQVSWYDPAMHVEAARRMHLERGLRTALSQGQLSLHYQPIVRLPDGEVVGAEALLRWHHPVEGLISPDVFVPLAEEAGVISELDVWVLERACRDVAGWRAAGVEVPRVSINISRRHMTSELPDVIRAALIRYGLPGESLCIEVTESTVVQDADVAYAALTRVRELGVTVALDDFGSGESSLSQLVGLPIDTVKIDRSFTQTALADLPSRRLLTSIVGVCRALSLPMVAEGIEQGELAGLLADAGCQNGQGFHFARPQPAADFVRLLPWRAPAVRRPWHDGVEAQVTLSR
jgi:diguanylate cyclase (GGDEF)-like protein/PAS domain S-box-containing protein